MEQLLAARSESAARWVRSCFPEGLPVPAAKEAAAGKGGSKAGGRRESAAGAEGARFAVGLGPEGRLPRGAGALPAHVRSAVEKQAERRQHFPEQTTHDAVAGIYTKWAEAEPGARAQGLGAFVHALFLRKESRLGAGEVQMSWLLKSAAMHAGRSSRCALFCALVGNSAAPLPPLPVVESVIAAWSSMVGSPGGTPVVEGEGGLHYVQPDRLQAALERALGRGGSEVIRKSVLAKAKARAREAAAGAPPGAPRSRTSGMLCVDEAGGLLLEELQAEYAGSTEAMLRGAYKQADSGGDGRLTLSDITRWVTSVCGPARPPGSALVLQVYLAARDISSGASSVPDAITADALVDVGRFFGLGLDDPGERPASSPALPCPVTPAAALLPSQAGPPGEGGEGGRTTGCFRAHHLLGT